jgi:hypothetical protein
MNNLANAALAVALIFASTSLLPKAMICLLARFKGLANEPATHA